MSGCKKPLAVGQYWTFCGETNSVLCHECGGSFRLKGSYNLDGGIKYTNRYSNPLNQRVLVRDLKLSPKWIPWLYSAPVKDL